MVAFAGVAASPQAASSAICSGINLPDEIEREERLVLNGMGLRRATIFGFKVYVAGLYVPERQVSAEEILGTDQPRVLVMVFLRDVDQRTIQASIAESIASNAGYGLGPVREKLDMVPRLLPEVRQGQSLIFDYAPGFGTAVMLDGETLANVEGDDFASALFTLWLGQPPNQELKIGLLGGICE